MKRSRIKRVNPERMKWRRLLDFGPPEYVKWLLETHNCWGCGGQPTDPHHLVTRGSRRGRPWHMVPVCRECHVKAESGKEAPWESRGSTHAVVYGRALNAWLRWWSQQGTCGPKAYWDRLVDDMRREGIEPSQVVEAWRERVGGT